MVLLGWCAPMPRQERRMKEKVSRERGQNLPTPTWATDALIGDKEQRKKERNRDQIPNPATLYHLVPSYNPHGSYGEPIQFQTV